MSCSKKDAIARLTEFHDSIDPILANLPLITALECAIAEIGKCINCRGTGQKRVDQNIGPGYKRLLDVNGKYYYSYPCAECKGSGKVLSGKCDSCGADYQVLPEQKFPASHCANCEEKLMRRGVLAY